MVDDVVPGEGVVLREQGDHPFGTGMPRVLGLGDFLKESRVFRVMQVAQEVDADALLRPAGNLHPGDQGYSVLNGRGGRLIPAGRGIVVRQRNDVQSGTGSRCHDVCGILGAVRDIGVGMQVNPHLSRVVDPAFTLRMRRRNNRPAPRRRESAPGAPPVRIAAELVRRWCRERCRKHPHLCFPAPGRARQQPLTAAQLRRFQGLHGRQLGARKPGAPGA